MPVVYCMCLSVAITRELQTCGLPRWQDSLCPNLVWLMVSNYTNASLDGLVPLTITEIWEGLVSVAIHIAHRKGSQDKQT